MRKYVYVYTADDKKFERLDKASSIKNAVFCVNDIESIAYLRRKYNIKAMNIDCIVDLLNVLKKNDQIFLCTPEESGFIKTGFANSKDICHES